MATAPLASSKAKVRGSGTGRGAAPRSAPGPGELGACRIAYADRDESVPWPRAQRDAGHESPATFGVEKCWRVPRPPADQLAHPASVGERARSTFRARKAIRQPKRAACVSAGRRAIIQRASCRWQLCHSPNARSARLHVYAVLPSDERPVMPRTGRITALKLGGLAGP